MATKRKQTRGSSGSAGRGRRKTGGASASPARGRSASGRSAGGAPRAMDAIKLLKQDHREVEKLIGEFERARTPKKAQIAEEICRQLSVHAQIEEEIFYPAARAALKSEDLVDEAEVEHRTAKDLIALIQGGAENELFEARVQVLGEYVKHHVREEEKEMFAQLQPRKIDLEELGRRMMQRKQELLGEAGDASAWVMDDESEPSGVSRGRGNGSRATREDSATMSARSTRG
jgi:hemerythrin superfamily protein